MSKTQKKRNEQLEHSADLIAKAAFTLCKSSLKSGRENPPDAKELKELCAAVKEAIAISSALDKNAPVTEEICIIMENMPDEFAE